jgi:hypothetical protein
MLKCGKSKSFYTRNSYFRNVVISAHKKWTYKTTFWNDDVYNINGNALRVFYNIDIIRDSLYFYYEFEKEYMFLPKSDFFFRNLFQFLAYRYL